MGNANVVRNRAAVMRFVDSDSASIGYCLHGITDKKQESTTIIYLQDALCA